MLRALWTTGITVARNANRTWTASADFQDGGHCESGSAAGTVRSNYAEARLSDAINVVKRSLDAMGITYVDGVPPRVFYDAQAEEPAPENWPAIAAEQEKRLGWTRR